MQKIFELSQNHLETSSSIMAPPPRHGSASKFRADLASDSNGPSGPNRGVVRQIWVPSGPNVRPLLWQRPEVGLVRTFRSLPVLVRIYRPGPKHTRAGSGRTRGRTRGRQHLLWDVCLGSDLTLVRVYLCRSFYERVRIRARRWFLKSLTTRSNPNIVSFEIIN